MNQLNLFESAPPPADVFGHDMLRLRDLDKARSPAIVAELLDAFRRVPAGEWINPYTHKETRAINKRHGLNFSFRFTLDALLRSGRIEERKNFHGFAESPCDATPMLPYRGYSLECRLKQVAA